VTLTLYNAAGERVLGQTLPASDSMGRMSFMWDNQGHSLTVRRSGVYFLRVTQGEELVGRARVILTH
jgi:hypothetical protein